MPIPGHSIANERAREPAISFYRSIDSAAMKSSRPHQAVRRSGPGGCVPTGIARRDDEVRPDLTCSPHDGIVRWSIPFDPFAHLEAMLARSDQRSRRRRAYRLNSCCGASSGCAYRAASGGVESMREFELRPAGARKLRGPQDSGQRFRLELLDGNEHATGASHRPSPLETY
jgi:hypothetical protein